MDPEPYLSKVGVGSGFTYLFQTVQKYLFVSTPKTKGPCYQAAKDIGK